MDCQEDQARLESETPREPRAGVEARQDPAKPGPGWGLPGHRHTSGQQDSGGGECRTDIGGRGELEPASVSGTESGMDRIPEKRRQARSRLDHRIKASQRVVGCWPLPGEMK